MIKPEDLLNAYDYLCFCAKQQIETIFTQKHQAELAAAFCNNWSYFMTPDTFSSAPKTLNNAQKILDMTDKPVKLQDIAARLDESHEFLRLSHLLLDYHPPVDLLPVSNLQSQSLKQNAKIMFILDKLRDMCKSYRNLTCKANTNEALQDLQLLKEFCNSYFWLGASLAPIRRKYLTFMQADKKRYLDRRRKNEKRIELYQKYQKISKTDREIFQKIAQEEDRLAPEGISFPACTPEAYRVWKHRAIKSGKLSLNIGKK